MCGQVSSCVSAYARNFCAGCWTLFAFGGEEMWYQTHFTNQMDSERHSRNDHARLCKERSPSLPLHEPTIQRNFAMSRWWTNFHALQRRISTRESTVGTIIAVNQLSVYGAVENGGTARVPPQTAEPRKEGGAGREIPPHFLMCLKKRKTTHLWAQGDLLRHRDERLLTSSVSCKVSSSVSISQLRKDCCQKTL